MENQNTLKFISAKSCQSEDCLTAISIQNSNSCERLSDDSMLSMSSVAASIFGPHCIACESCEDSIIDSSTNLSDKLSSISTQSKNKELNSKLNYSTEGMDTAQNDDYDIFARKLMIRLINNLRTKHVHQDDARIILMRRGETVSEVFPNWIVNVHDNSKLYVSRLNKNNYTILPYDLNMPDILLKRERNNDFSIDPPLTNISAHFATKLGFGMTQNLPKIVYSAPELAMLQTAQQLIAGTEIKMNWFIEPGLVRYFSPDESRPIFTMPFQQETIYTMEAINNIIGKETINGFENRIAKVISKLKFPPKTSTVLIAEDCVINAIIQKFIRNDNKLTTKQRLTINKRIPQLSLMHFDIDSNGKWKPSSASLPGLQGITHSMFNQPDVNFLIRPVQDF